MSVSLEPNKIKELPWLVATLKKKVITQKTTTYLGLYLNININDVAQILTFLTPLFLAEFFILKFCVERFKFGRNFNDVIKYSFKAGFLIQSFGDQ